MNSLTFEYDFRLEISNYFTCFTKPHKIQSNSITILNNNRIAYHLVYTAFVHIVNITATGIQLSVKLGLYFKHDFHYVFHGERERESLKRNERNSF